MNGSDELMQICEVMKPDDVLIDLSASSKSGFLSMVAEIAASRLGVPEGEILGALQNREELGSTGIGAGIAIPHACVDGVGAPFMLLARLTKPIDFEAVDEAPVDVVCMILTPSGEQSHYLTLLSRITRRLRCADALDAIRRAPDSGQVYRAFAV